MKTLKNFIRDTYVVIFVVSFFLASVFSNPIKRDVLVVSGDHGLSAVYAGKTIHLDTGAIGPNDPTKVLPSATAITGNYGLSTVAVVGYISDPKSDMRQDVQIHSIPKISF